MLLRLHFFCKQPLFLIFIGSIRGGKADLAIGMFVVRKERLMTMDMLIFLTKQPAHIYIKNPRDAFDWEVYTKPLTKNAWFGIFGFFLLVPPLLMVTLTDCKGY